MSHEARAEVGEALQALALTMNDLVRDYLIAERARICCPAHGVENAVAALLSVSMALLSTVTERREAEDFVQDFLDMTRAAALGFGQQVSGAV